MTVVDRATHCLIGIRIARFVSDDLIQELVDESPQAHWYYSDQLPAYAEVAYGEGIYRAMPDKSQTYSVEADNAELRHYLARLGRDNRCFNRSIHALRSAVRILAYCWNQRQLYKQRWPSYHTELIDFLSPCC
jgi:IS1 family transposase